MTLVFKPSIDHAARIITPSVPRAALVRGTIAALCLALLSGCGADQPTDDAETAADDNDVEVVNLPQTLVTPEPIDWTPPDGDSYEDAITAYDQARESKIGEHPGYGFAGDIWQRLVEDDHPPSLYHLGLLHYFGNGREFNHNLTGEYIRKSAAFGYPVAYAFMALQNEGGDGSLFLKSEDKALENWLEAAAGGHCGAIKRLVRAYSNAELGLSMDSAKVAELEQKIPDCVVR